MKHRFRVRDDGQIKMRHHFHQGLKERVWCVPIRVMQAHSTVIFEPVFRNIRGKALVASKRGLDNDMLQQCELRVMRREKEGPSRVHFNSKILFFLLERHLAQVAWSLSVLNLICIPQSTHALDQGGVEPRQAVSPRPGGQGRYRFATASVTLTAKYSGSNG